jgi:TrmH family RNA methyltransferase
MEYSCISSRKNEKIILNSKLKDKKTRDKEGLFFIEGSKLLEEAIKEGLEVIRIFFTQTALDKYEEIISSVKGAEFILVTDDVYEKLTEETAPQGIFAVIKKPDTHTFSPDELSQGGFLILEDIQNPLNIGAIFRCAYSLGTDKIVMTKSCADVYNTKALRSAMGSIFKTKFIYTDSLHSFIENQQKCGNRVICTALYENSEVLGRFNFEMSDSIVIGNEGNGIKRETLDLCRLSLIIPMLKGAESLNAATACSVVLWEMNKDKLISLN